MKHKKRNQELVQLLWKKKVYYLVGIGEMENLSIYTWKELIKYN